MADLEIYLRIGQISVMKFFVAEQCKPNEIFRRMSAVYEEACFSQKCLQMSKIIRGRTAKSF